MKGYKGFNKDMTCRGFQYEVGKEYEHKGSIKLCDRGFHFCKKIGDVQNFYNITGENYILCEIEATGRVIEGDDKCVTDKIKIIREISKDEMYILGNEGAENTGVGNTGNSNTGNYNTGNYNTGDCNTGYYNTGNYNTGDCNTGYYNTGDRNTGYYNTGYYNTGDRNTGNSNTGNCNTGNYNTGYRNTGDYNTGYYNTGDWNKTDRSAGVFCNAKPKLVMFNKETDMTWEEWKNSEAYDILTRNLKSQWVGYDNMTEEEDGYLKEIERSTSSKEWWNELEMHEKAIIIQLPNFNLDVFNDIMEFEVTKKEYEEIEKWLESK